MTLRSHVKSCFFTEEEVEEKTENMVDSFFASNNPIIRFCGSADAHADFGY